MSAITYGPPLVVDGPLPQARPFGFASVATLVPEESERWESGVQVHSFPPDLPQSHNQCDTGTFAVKDEGGAIPLPEFGAFTVYLAETCTARGMGNDEQFRARASLTLDAVEDFAVEREFSQGVQMTGNPFLSDGNESVLNGGAAIDALEAMALLEDAIAGNTGRAGVIHATPGTVSRWSKEFLVFEKNLRLVTANGTPVISGAGYLGAISNGTAPGADQAWAFATGPVQYRRSEIFMMPDRLDQALDRTVNTVTYRAERYYLVDWDTALQAAVLVDRSM